MPESLNLHKNAASFLLPLPQFALITQHNTTKLQNKTTELQPHILTQYKPTSITPARCSSYGGILYLQKMLYAIPANLLLQQKPWNLHVSNRLEYSGIQTAEFDLIRAGVWWSKTGFWWSCVIYHIRLKQFDTFESSCHYIIWTILNIQYHVHKDV